jgi:hypothetical protein
MPNIFADPFTMGASAIIKKKKQNKAERLEGGLKDYAMDAFNKTATSDILKSGGFNKEFLARRVSRKTDPSSDIDELMSKFRSGGTL